MSCKGNSKTLSAEYEDPLGYVKTEWTPIITQLNVGTPTVTYTSRTATYIRIGDLVTFTARIVFNYSTTAANFAFAITNFPFSPATQVTLPGFQQNLSTAPTNAIYLDFGQNATTCSVRTINYEQITGAATATGNEIRFTISFIV